MRYARYGVTFAGDMTAEEEAALRRAGFVVHRNGIGEGWAGFEADDPNAITTRSRHVVLNVEGPRGHPAAAIVLVEQVIGRNIEDPHADDGTPI